MGNRNYTTWNYTENTNDSSEQSAESQARNKSTVAWRILSISGVWNTEDEIQGIPKWLDFPVEV